MAETPKATPKRKRGAETIVLAPMQMQFSFDLSQGTSSEDGSNSPRTKVAHKFRGLLLETAEGGGGASEGDDARSVCSEPEAGHKRQKFHEAEVGDRICGLHDYGTMAITGPEDGAEAEPQLAVQPPGDEAAATVEPAAVAACVPTGPPPKKPGPKVRKKKRAGTPPPRQAKMTGDGEEEREIVDPVRAALTWREDEITVYDPEDQDDDGTGINGVGFKPTPAIAHARVMKRRQQVAEYRKREESDARARRSQRRQAAVKLVSSSEPSSTTRKVKFLEGEKLAFVTMTS